MKGRIVINILELGLKAIVLEHYEDFKGSLRAEGVNVEEEKWSPGVIDNNAQAGAEILMLYEEREDFKFLPVILYGLEKGEYLLTLAYIYTLAESNHWLPPYGIIQHAVDDKLLEEYCECLKSKLRLYASTQSAKC